MVYWFARLLVMEEETTGQSLFEAARGAQIDLADMARAGLLQRNNCPIEIALGLSASVGGSTQGKFGPLNPPRLTAIVEPGERSYNLKR